MTKTKIILINNKNYKLNNKHSNLTKIYKINKLKIIYV